MLGLADQQSKSLFGGGPDGLRVLDSDGCLGGPDTLEEQDVSWTVLSSLRWVGEDHNLADLDCTWFSAASSYCAVRRTRYDVDYGLHGRTADGERTV